MLFISSASLVTGSYSGRVYLRVLWDYVTPRASVPGTCVVSKRNTPLGPTYSPPSESFCVPILTNSPNGQSSDELPRPKTLHSQTASNAYQARLRAVLGSFVHTEVGHQPPTMPINQFSIVIGTFFFAPIACFTALWAPYCFVCVFRVPRKKSATEIIACLMRWPSGA